MAGAESVMGIPVARTIADLRAIVAAWRAAGQQVALVPTMGALHAGHLALLAAARRRAERAITSIFVNPAQFAANEDLARYPRTFDDDCRKLADAGCDLVWAPDVAAMYPEGFATRVVPAGAANGLESDTRPHFFGGVATVCTKLFVQTGADAAIFGEKDYQQLQVIRQTVRDLDIAIEIIAHPTIREQDGLAMSSRNAYLSPDERRIAPVLHRVLEKIAQEISRSADASTAIRRGEAELTDAGFRIDYIAVRDALTLSADTDTSRPRRVLAAAWLGRTRLIDNVAVEASP